MGFIPAPVSAKTVEAPKKEQVVVLPVREAAPVLEEAPVAALPEAVNDQITDSVTVETPAAEPAQDVKPAGKNPFKKKP